MDKKKAFSELFKNNKNSKVISNYRNTPAIINTNEEVKVKINDINNEKAIYVYEYRDGYARRIKINDAPDEEW